MTTSRRSLVTLALTALLALAGVMSGWNGRPLNLGEEIALEQFVLQGGALADLCDETGAIGKSGAQHHHDCQICHSVGGLAVLPGPAGTGPVLAGLGPADLPYSPNLPTVPKRWTAVPPRGPPQMA